MPDAGQTKSRRSERATAIGVRLSARSTTLPNAFDGVAFASKSKTTLWFINLSTTPFFKRCTQTTPSIRRLYTSKNAAKVYLLTQ